MRDLILINGTWIEYRRHEQQSFNLYKADLEDRPFAREVAWNNHVMRVLELQKKYFELISKINNGGEECAT